MHLPEQVEAGTRERILTRTITLAQKRLQQRLTQAPPQGLLRDEVEAHFRGMPTRYWETVTKGELVWALETVHAFLEKLRMWEAPGAPAVATLRHCPERGFTKVMVCTWDRPGLLARIAATFGALRLNILQSDIYTRRDNVALDIFQVSDLENAQDIDAKRLEHLVFLLEGSLNEPPRFVSMWARQFHKLYQIPRGNVILELDNDSSPQNTVLRVEAPDRLGLLYDVLEALNECYVNVAQAIVHTDGATARDIFYITDLEGAKITNKLALGTIRKIVLEALRVA